MVNVYDVLSLRWCLLRDRRSFPLVAKHPFCFLNCILVNLEQILLILIILL